MTVSEVSRLLRARALTDGEAERAVESCMVCDVLSLVMAGGRRNMAWITVRSSMNALAVACMTGASCLIFPKGAEPERAVTDRAEEEKIAILAADMSAFEIAGILYGAGLRGEVK